MIVSGELLLVALGFGIASVVLKYQSPQEEMEEIPRGPGYGPWGEDQER